jgi:hypothetical protein
MENQRGRKPGGKNKVKNSSKIIKVHTQNLEKRIKELEEFIEETINDAAIYGSHIYKKGIKLLNKKQ